MESEGNKEKKKKSPFFEDLSHRRVTSKPFLRNGEGELVCDIFMTVTLQFFLGREDYYGPKLQYIYPT